MFATNTFKLPGILNFILLFLTIGQSPLRAQENPLSTKKQKVYSIEERNNLFFQALAVFPENRIPVQYRSSLPEPSPVRHATMILGEVRQNFDIFNVEQQEVLNQLLQRPVLPLSFISSTGRFKIHYTETGTDAVPLEDINNNGIPDFVEAVAQAFENSHQREVDELGYQEPPNDAGVDGPEYDVYVQNLGRDFYSFTIPESNPAETPQNDRTSYIVIENDFSQHFTRGVAAAKVTAAHEYFHAIQFGYRNFSLVNDERYYYELCSVWMEDVIYDEVNDYYQYLPVFFRRTDIPFNMFDQFGHYLGQALWNHFLVKKYGDFDVIRRTWEIMQNDVPVLNAIDQSLNEKGSSFVEEFTDFAAWNYFTGTRADPINYYDESPEYPEILLNDELEIVSDASVADSSLSLTHKYYKFTVLTSGEYSILGFVEEPSNWMFAAIITVPGSAPKFRVFHPLTGQNFGFLPSLSEIVVIPVNLKILNDADLTLLNSTFLSFSFNIRPRRLEMPVERGITEFFPNPFRIDQHQEISFVFFGTENENIEVRIFSSDGRVIKSDNLSGNSNIYSWDGKDNNGELVSSGVYIFQLKQRNFIDIRKFAVLRD
jgi:hypothetical protein